MLLNLLVIKKFWNSHWQFYPSKAIWSQKYSESFHRTCSVHGNIGINEKNNLPFTNLQMTVGEWFPCSNSLTQHIHNAYIKLKLNLTATKNRTSRVYRNKKPKWKETIEFDVNDKKLSNGNMRKKQFLGRVKLFGNQFKRKGEEGLVYYQLEKSWLCYWSSVDWPVSEASFCLQREVGWARQQNDRGRKAFGFNIEGIFAFWARVWTRGFMKL